MTCLSGKIWFLQDALGRIDVRQIESRPGVAGIENGRQPDTALQGPNHDSVHLVICDVAGLSEVDRVYDFVVAVGLVAVKILGLSTMACRVSAIKPRGDGDS